MATKVYPLPFKSKQDFDFHSNGQYKNFNFKQKSSSNAFSKSSKNVSSENRKVLNYASTKLLDFANNNYSKTQRHSWNKATKNLSPTFGSTDVSKKESGEKISWSSPTSNSTLSLHIEAYENSTVFDLFDGTKKSLKQNGLIQGNAKQLLTQFESVIHNPFEFPRQQENVKAKTPEVAQYTASQRLLNPNQMRGPPVKTYTMFGRLNGIIFASLLFLTSLLGSVFICFPFIPLAFFAPRIFRFVCDRFVGYWLTFPASMLTFMFGVKFHVSGDLIEHSKPSLIIMNHRTRLDWMFFWNALYKMNPWLLTSEKISLKSGLKSIPGAGWAMGCGGYIFLNRNYELDQRILETMLQYYKESQCSYQLLLFPEGTDRGERAARISDEFAKKNGLQKYDYVLHPRTTGFNFILNEMRKHDYIDAIYDVTVAYPDKIVPSETDLITKGILPKNVHFDIKKYKLSDILTEEQNDKFHRDPIDASTWLLNLWKEKEARLKKFYSQSPERRKLEPSGKGFVWPVETKGIGYYLAFLFWIITSLMWLYFTITIFWVKLYIIGAILFYLYAHKYHGGSEFLFLEWFFGRRFFFERTQ